MECMSILIMPSYVLLLKHLCKLHVALSKDGGLYPLPPAPSYASDYGCLFTCGRSFECSFIIIHASTDLVYDDSSVILIPAIQNLIVTLIFDGVYWNILQTFSYMGVQHSYHS